MRISDWSSDVCSSDLVIQYALFDSAAVPVPAVTDAEIAKVYKDNAAQYAASETRRFAQVILPDQAAANALAAKIRGGTSLTAAAQRSEEHTSELQSLMRISYAVFCLKKKNKQSTIQKTEHT